jgi:hypothetical protein
MLRFRKEIRRRRFGRGRLRSRRGGVGPGPTLRECSLPLHFRHLANLMLFARTNDDQQSQGGKGDPLPQRKSHKRRQSKVHFARCARPNRGGSRKRPTPKTYRGRLLNAQRSTSNFEYSAIGSATLRWIGRSEGDATAEAAKPLILSACGALCLTSRSELAIHRLCVLAPRSELAIYPILTQRRGYRRWIPQWAQSGTEKSALYN